MPSFFYTDEAGTKHPVNDQQLQTLAMKGVIKPETPLETDTGHTGLAGQIPGLQFNTSTSSPFAQSALQMTDRTRSQQNAGSGFGSVAQSVKSWLTDFAFQDLRLPVINLWACQIIYVVCCIVAILWALGMTLMGLGSLGPHPGLLILVPLFWIGAILFIFLARLCCEWYIIVFDWIVETTKAARKYTEE